MAGNWSCVGSEELSVAVTQARSVKTHRVVTVRTEIRALKLFAHHSQIHESEDEQPFILPYFIFKKG